MRAPLALLRLRRADAAGQLVRPTPVYMYARITLAGREGFVFRTLARGRHRQNAMGISTALGAGVAPLVCRLALVSAMVPAMVPAACVLYGKRSRPLPREVLQCGRPSARAQAAPPRAALPPTTAALLRPES